MKLVTGHDKNDAWRLSLPKDACRHLGWAPGDTIIVSVSREGKMVLEKVE
jgi:bifunctional DNA-binding transcriptional regulator/antitoxin component of YhaV-PrlF toxin-antitoxin module